MGSIQLLKGNIRGMDADSAPGTLAGKVAHAVNLQFKRGEIRTRPGIRLHNLDVKGPLQGCLGVNPGSGVSLQTFGEDAGYLVLVAGGKVVVKSTTASGFSLGCRVLRPSLTDTLGRDTNVCVQDFIWLYKAEHLVILQGQSIPTMWWAQDSTALTVSAGLSVAYQDADHVNGMTFMEEKVDNWLVNAAGLGVFAHGRVHQQMDRVIMVSDMIHAKGQRGEHNFLYMEEQLREACGGPLSTRSDLGALRALTVAANPSAGALGEGMLTAYYTQGVVMYNTGVAPRETRFNPATGEEITKGWEYQNMVSPVCNEVSATGPYAVAVLLRDQLFRSVYGLHFLSRVMQQNTAADEPVDLISNEVGPILNEDSRHLLHGVSVGYWIGGHRLLATTGMVANRCAGVLPAGTALVVYNKLWGRTEDDSPLPAWDGVWIPPAGLTIHRLMPVPRAEGPSMYGFLASTSLGDLMFGEFMDIDSDVDCGNVIDIPWVMTTDRVSRGYNTSSLIDSGSLTLHQRARALSIRVLVRTNRYPDWAEWIAENSGREEPGCWQKPLGSPPGVMREAEWFQFRIEGIGAATISAFDLDVSAGVINTQEDFVPSPPDSRDPAPYLSLTA